MTFPRASTHTESRAPLQPGFADPVLGSQQYFRAALEALSRPGKIVAVDGGCTLGMPARFCPATAGLCLTLMDVDTPVWLDQADEAAGWLRFHCGCRVVEDASEAVFAVIAEPKDMPHLESFTSGTLRDPHLAATLIIQIDGFGDPHHPDALTLTGPGVEGSIRLAPQGLPGWFRDAFSAQRIRFPLGVDVFLTAGGTIAGLPRSVRIATEGDALCM